MEQTLLVTVSWSILAGSTSSLSSALRSRALATSDTRLLDVMEKLPQAFTATTHWTKQSPYRAAIQQANRARH